MKTKHISYMKKEEERKCKKYLMVNVQIPMQVSQDQHKQKQQQQQQQQPKTKQNRGNVAGDNLVR